ncbi:YfhO family protein [Porcipelethomonas sp.]|uniref:YfhO family protein n=1 Tax=Porcipelethomonas sp. TaxID=2981675 RepID=UPI003EFA50F4
MTGNTLLRSKSNNNYFKIFFMGFLSLFIILLPIIIYTGGYYIYYGDYNSQQIPFYLHAHDFIKNEGLGWDWGTDLGANFLGSYSFYLLGSPFFWLTIPLPHALVVFAMPVLLAMKHGIAAVTAYAYIKRFVRNKNAAAIGGMLYAFSGFQMFNIFFNHFQDVTAFFPLMLIALEERVNNNRRGVFAASVALMGIINYFFFAGQAVFVILYILVRIKSPDFKITWKKFFSIALEAIMGVMIAMVMLLPSALAILGNYRVNERLYGLDLVTYSDRTRIIRIIQSFFMIPDVPARPNLFSTDGAKWASIGGYLPMFSMAGVIAFSKAKKKHWSVKLIIICMICAFIPILNSAFYTFNSSYYARWFYMPILIMAMMTAQALDDKSIKLKSGIAVCGVVMAGLAVISILPKKTDEEVTWFEFANYPAYFAVVLIISIAGLVLLYFIERLRKKGRSYMTAALVSTVTACVVCTASVVYFGVTLGSYPATYINNGIYGSDNLSLDDPEEQFYRIDISENYDNYPMFWGYSSMRAFQSIVPGSIMEFYPEIGVTRDVASRAPLEKSTIRGLFSVKYYFDKVYSDQEETYTYICDLPGFEYKNTQNGFYVYENKYYLPMGFTFDNYVTEKNAESYSEQTRERILLRALILNDEQAEKYSDIINKLPADQTVGLNDSTYIEDCIERKKETCSEFSYDSEGFDAEISLDSSKLVFFSVPYDDGWTAYVNGKPVDIEKVSYGFMAVKAEAGDNTIEFRYETPGLKIGAVISVIGLVILIVYIIIFRKKKDELSGFSHFYNYDCDNSCRLEEEYKNKIISKYKTEE